MSGIKGKTGIYKRTKKHNMAISAARFGHEVSSETRMKIGKANSKPLTHGLSYHPLYPTWGAMINRTTNKKDKNYFRYGAVGRGVCESWLKIENFIADMENSHFKGAFLDRVDNNKGYSPENCHWVKPIENSWNTKSNRIIEFQGKKQPLGKWCYEFGLKVGTVWSRLNRGESLDIAFRPVSKNLLNNPLT